MSHELRTPLNSLLILARLLADNPGARLSEQEEQFASTIYRSGSDLLQLINDILDLPKIEAGRMDVHAKSLPLSKLLDYVRATFRPLTSDRGLAFDISVADDVPRDLFSDEQRLQQVLRNLLSSAVKFTARGKVELRVTRAAQAQFEEETLRDAETVIAFSVADTGIGIAPEKISVIFEAFQQSDGATSRKYGGTGLGLSISREVAGILGGRIVVESAVGVGSTFTLYVPSRHPSSAALSSDAGRAPLPVDALPPPPTEVQESTAEVLAHTRYTAVAGPPQTLSPDATAEQAEQRSAAADEQDNYWPQAWRLKEWRSGPSGDLLKGRQVLIIDDDIRNVFALIHALGRVGMTVKYAENGAEGIETLMQSPDASLILMDIMMPGMDGYQTIRAIRQMPQYVDLPIIALTAKAMPGDREKAIDSGASGYVPKPVDLDRLLSEACSLLAPGQHTPVNRSAEAGTVQPQAPEGEAP